MVTHPINSHLFPSRGRSNSTPTARPSSLSRLLAQASPTAEVVNDAIGEKTPSPRLVVEVLSSSPPQESFPQKILVGPSTATNTNNVVSSGSSAVNGKRSPTTNSPTPLRPGSRASKLSTTSRFSVSRKPTLGIVAGSVPKAAPTTALSDQALTKSPSASTDNNNPFRSPLTSSPDESITEAMSDTMDNDVFQRRRTTSYHAPQMTSTSSQATVVARPTSAASVTLANLASSWGVAFGRKKKADLAVGVLTPPVESPAGRNPEGQADGSLGNGKSARDLLKRF